MHEILAGQEGVDIEAHDQVGTHKCRGDGGRCARMMGRAEREEDQLGDFLTCAACMRPWGVRVRQPVCYAILHITRGEWAYSTAWVLPVWHP